MTIRRGLALAVGMLSLFGAIRAAHADGIEIEGRLIRQDGSPIAGENFRVVVGSEKDSHGPSAGAVVKTDAEGRFKRTLEAPVERRWITVYSPFIPQRPLHIAVAVEMDLLGRRALYWVNLDYLKSGVLSQMVAYIADRNGRFDRLLTFKSSPPTYTFPDEPDGMQLSGIGAELKSWEMVATDLPDGKTRWTVRIEIEKHEFKRR
jgi:hypothetical protein